jgi:hypothetical protein
LKLAASTLFLIALASTLAFAQTPAIKHVIVIVQENRTPDNLFGSDAFDVHPQLPHAHLSQTGPCVSITHPPDESITLTPFRLDACFDPNHSHADAWTPTWDAGGMDGACTTHVIYGSGSLCTNQLAHCTDTDHAYCPQYTYVSNGPLTGSYHTNAHILDPYFNIAKNYGFANYMFQTNQGPSFPAHQFLFSGTSAPDKKDDPQNFYQWFAAENPYKSDNSYTDTVGCAASPAGEYVMEADPSGGESKGYDPPPESVGGAGYPCYDHPTLAALIDPNHNLSWKYYTHKPASDQGGSAGSSIWTAPNAITNICQASGGVCKGPDWNFVIPPGPASLNQASPILNDLGASGTCGLPSVSWVIPDGQWSDHPGSGPGSDGGPGWVAAIVNAVGGYDNDGHALPTQCYDTINGQQYSYWQDTVILITWDDWGGFYDDVVPPDCSTTTGICSGYFRGNGNGQQYVYGFRVPLLVVSAYAGTYNGTSWSGYISGPQTGAVCPGRNYCHDFGSILNFIENTFSLGTNGINGGIYPYADSFAMDAFPNCTTNCTYSLADFFDYNAPQRPFTFIQGANYPTACYMDPTNPLPNSNCFPNWPSDPDNDGTED